MKLSARSAIALFLLLSASSLFVLASADNHTEESTSTATAADSKNFTDSFRCDESQEGCSSSRHNSTVSSNPEQSTAHNDVTTIANVGNEAAAPLSSTSVSNEHPHHGIKARKGVRQYPTPPAASMLPYYTSTSGASTVTGVQGRDSVDTTTRTLSTASSVQTVVETSSLTARPVISDTQRLIPTMISAPATLSVASSTSGPRATEAHDKSAEKSTVTRVSTSSTAASLTSPLPTTATMTTSSAHSDYMSRQGQQLKAGKSTEGLSTTVTESHLSVAEEAAHSTTSATSKRTHAARKHGNKSDELSREYYHILIGLCFGFVVLIYVLIHVTVTVHDILKRRQYGSMDRRCLIDERRFVDEEEA